MCGEEKNILYGLTRQPRQDKILLGWHKEPTKEGPLSYVLHESPFASIVTVRQWPPLSDLSRQDSEEKNIKNSDDSECRLRSKAFTCRSGCGQCECGPSFCEPVRSSPITARIYCPAPSRRYHSRYRWNTERLFFKYISWCKEVYQKISLCCTSCL